MPSTHTDRQPLRDAYDAQERDVLEALNRFAPSESTRRRAAARAAVLVQQIRSSAQPGLMESFLAEYGLSTQEGLALMTMAEALLRVPDALTADTLIADKIGAGDWREHRGGSGSRLVNAATEGLVITRRVLAPDVGHEATLRGAVRRLGAPVIRTATRRAMREMGDAFVLGRDIDEAIKRGAGMVKRGFTYSYDMLGEAAMTMADADHFDRAYSGAIERLAKEATKGNIRNNPGISVKLSALHPRYQTTQSDRVMAELAPRLLRLCQMAAKADMGLNIDAEEANRLEISLDVIESVLADPSLAGWDGFGVVVQAYSKRAAPVLDWLYALAQRLDRKIMVRLVKGAYWDSEIKRAQVEGLEGFPVFTRKAASDVSWICNAAKLLGMTDRIYPQFATHNAHSAASVLEIAEEQGIHPDAWEFQRLHGMGEALYDLITGDGSGIHCRIYAPVGPHKDLLAYLARRMLENGANSSFVNQVVDNRVPPEDVVQDPWDRLAGPSRSPSLKFARDLFAPERANSTGIELQEPASLSAYEASRANFGSKIWQAEPLLAEGVTGPMGEVVTVTNPARPDDTPGQVTRSGADLARAAIDAARPWDAPVETRAAILEAGANAYEAHAAEIFAILAREAGKTMQDAVAELREAVDFLNYYAAEARRGNLGAPLGVVTAISPWNFPLAIFSGQIAAALAAGNAVLAKPAETTSLLAHFAVTLLHEAGVPRSALQLLPGRGSELGPVLTGSDKVDGVVFTGSTATAQGIHKAMAEGMAPGAPLIAETGGLNAMIVDSTALPEQVVRDVLASSFQSAGQRCSALRLLYLQEDVADGMLKMLYGAMDQLRVGDPWKATTDVGPVIDAKAKAGIDAHIEAMRAEGRVLHQVEVPKEGHFVAPTVIRLPGIEALEQEIFGPVLHVATYKAEDLDKVIAAINGRGYGLTFGLHSRIGGRVEDIASRMHIGNVYVNRNQIGAIVGSQPFGGEGLSGTGPKAGGPAYVPAFTRQPDDGVESVPVASANPLSAAEIQARIDGLQQAAISARSTPVETLTLPGPTGETNHLSRYGRGVILCLGPTPAQAAAQAAQARRAGAVPLELPGDIVPAEALAQLTGFAGVACRGDAARLRAIRKALAGRDGAILPLMTGADITPRCAIERHVSVDTTAAGGNAALLALGG